MPLNPSCSIRCASSSVALRRPATAARLTAGLGGMHTSSVAYGDSDSLARLYCKLHPALRQYPSGACLLQALGTAYNTSVADKEITSTSWTNGVGISWLRPDWRLRTGVRSMEFGTFYQLPCAAEQSPLQRYEDTLMQIQRADSLGLDVAWLAELQFFPTFSIMPSPLLVASALAQRTHRIRLGIAVNLLPLHHPLRNAEDAATLDILSNGRLEYGAGRGSIPLHFAGYNVALEESRERFLEALDVVLLAWTTDSFSYEGKYYHGLPTASPKMDIQSARAQSLLKEAVL